MVLHHSLLQCRSTELSDEMEQYIIIGVVAEDGKELSNILGFEYIIFFLVEEFVLTAILETGRSKR